MKPGRVARYVASRVCWVLAVLVGAGSVAQFVLGGVTCTTQEQGNCGPQTGIMMGGVALAIVLGVAGAVLWKPRQDLDHGRPLPPWEYRN